MENYNLAIKYLYDAFLCSLEWFPIKVFIGKAILKCLHHLDDFGNYAHVVPDILFDRQTTIFLSTEESQEFYNFSLLPIFKSEPITLNIDQPASISYDVTFSNAYAEVGDKIYLNITFNSHLKAAIIITALQISFGFGIAEVDIPDNCLKLEPMESRLFTSSLILPYNNSMDQHTSRRPNSSRLIPFSSGLTLDGKSFLAGRKGIVL